MQSANFVLMMKLCASTCYPIIILLYYFCKIAYIYWNFSFSNQKECEPHCDIYFFLAKD